MAGSAKFFVVMGCLLILVAVILKGMWLVNPAMAIRVIKPSSFLILANTSFLLAILLKK